jgi:hypothetical protein
MGKVRQVAAKLSSSKTVSQLAVNFPINRVQKIKLQVIGVSPIISEMF